MDKNEREYIRVLKPKDRPIQIEPWFFRYLNAGQLKVLSAIIAHADYATRSKDSFASNKTLAFYAGFGLINPDTKDYEIYHSLNPEDKAAYKKQKMTNAIATVKNVKRELEKLGVIKREITTTKSYIFVDLEWGKERYLREFDEYFNEDKAPVQTSEKDVNEELESLTKLAAQGNISKIKLASELESITDRLKEDLKTGNEALIPEEDIDKTVEHIMNSSATQNKIKNGQIKNAEGWKTSTKQRIKKNTFNGVETYYKGLIQKERAEILELLFATYQTREYKGELYIPYEPIFKDNLINIEYVNSSGTDRVLFVVTPDLIRDILTPENYTTTTQNFIKTYEKNYIIASEQNKGGKKDLQRTG